MTPASPARGAQADPDGGAEAALFEARDVYAGYRTGVDVIHGLDLSLADGELVGVIGPNGAGKSTLIKAMFGLVPVRSGVIRLRGDDLTNRPAHDLVARGVGYAPQGGGVFPSLTVAENLEMGSFLRPRRHRERVGFVTELFPVLGERASARAGALSGGQRQMLAMARALMPDPEVLLLDEPSAGLAPSNVDDVFQRVADTNDAGVAMIMVEQNARRCLQIAHTGYVLDQGTTAYSGPGDELLADERVVSLYLGTLARSG